jgi:putative methyltransferase (TIGR04325 family)
MNLRDFVPPIVGRLRARLGAFRADGPATFSTYAEALRACGGQGYEETELARMICEKTKIYRDQVAREPALKISSTDAYGLLAAAYGLAAASPKRRLSVVDFGGACGAHYFTFKKFFEDSVDLNWIVVETKVMCEAAAPLAGPELEFRSDLDETLTQVGMVDLLHASGTIQFVAEPYRILKRIASSGARHLLFNRLSLGSGNDDVIAIHRSMLSWNGVGPLPAGFRDREVRYPYTLLSKQRFEAELTGYEVVVNFEEATGAPLGPNEGVSNLGRLYRLRQSRLP